MKKQNIRLGLLLIGLSVILYGVHFTIFHDMHHIVIFLFADIAFVPLEVFFVSLVLEQLINKREEGKILNKMHMLVGLFYQKFGDELLAIFVNASMISCQSDKILMDYKWTKKQYQELRKIIQGHPHKIDIEKVDLQALYTLLKANEPLMINLISNPSLQENEIFSDLLLATFHLYDELGSRDLSSVTGDDLEHLTFDCKRVFKSLSIQWVDYMEHLQESYPYLFLTAALNNPYDTRNQDLITAALMQSRESLS